MVTHASRNVGLRTRGNASTGAYKRSPLEPSQGLPPDTYLPSNMSPYSGLPPASYPPSNLDPDPIVNTVRPEAPALVQGFGYGGGSPTAIESNVPPPPVYEPGGSNVDYPLPPSRPSGLGQVLSSAVQGNAPAPLPPVRPQAQPQAPNPFMITAPNSDPLARNRPQMGALDLSGLLGGLFGGRR